MRWYHVRDKPVPVLFTANGQAIQRTSLLANTPKMFIYTSRLPRLTSFWRFSATSLTRKNEEKTAKYFRRSSRSIAVGSVWGLGRRRAEVSDRDITEERSRQSRNHFSKPEKLLKTFRRVVVTGAIIRKRKIFLNNLYAGSIPYFLTTLTRHSDRRENRD